MNVIDFKILLFVISLICFYLIVVTIWILSSWIKLILIDVFDILDRSSDNSFDIMYPYQCFCEVQQQKILEWCKEFSVAEPKFITRNSKTLLVSRSKEALTQIILVFGTIQANQDIFQ